MKRVLSIDGGGIRGIIPAVLCQKCEEYAGRPLSSLFDVIAGTSTGGILALGLVVPPNGKPAKDLAEFYLNYGNRIFSSPRNWIGQLTKSKFSNDGLRDASAEVFGSTKISEAITEVLVTAYDTQLRGPLYLTRERAKSDASLNLMMRDIAIATSAAPTIFQPHRFDRYVLVDGGVVANNPSCIAYAHAKKLWPTEDIMLLSLGTGVLRRPLSALRTQDWGQIRWARPLIDCLFSGYCKETVNDFFRYAHLSNYLRLQGNLNNDTEALDGASPEAMDGLKSIAVSIFNHQEGEIVRFVDRLKIVGDKLTVKITSPLDTSPVQRGRLRIGKESLKALPRRIYLCIYRDGRKLLAICADSARGRALVGKTQRRAHVAKCDRHCFNS